MIGGLFLLAFSLVTAGLAGNNLRNCIIKGSASAYGHSYSRAENSVAYWISAACSVIAVLLGLALALAAIAGLLG